MSQSVADLNFAYTNHLPIAAQRTEPPRSRLPGAAVSIVIASAQPLLCEGIRELLKSREGIEVIAETGSVLSGVEISVRRCPDILLADVSMKDSETVRQLSDAAARLGGTRLLLLTDSTGKAEICHLMSAGIRGVLLGESVNARVLLAAIRAVMSGERWLGKEIVAAVLSDQRVLAAPSKPSRPFGLTLREMEVLPIVVAGSTNAQIAQKLSISLQTVKHHISSIFDKTGVDTRLELALFAHHHHLLDNTRPQPETGQLSSGSHRGAA